MSFTDGYFFLFLLLLFPLYYLLPKAQRWILLAFNFVFYAFQGLIYLAFLVYTVGVTYAVTMLLDRKMEAERREYEASSGEWDKARKKQFRKEKKRERLPVFVWGLFFGFGVLAVFKYAPFTLSLFGVRTGAWLLPLGLSFYTFQSMGYVIDVAQKKVTAEKNLLHLSLFVTFFPQLIQGPISRFSDLEGQFLTPHRFEKSPFCEGLMRVLWGYFKKVAVADTALVAVKTLTGEGYDGAYVFLLILLYSLEIYADFTGGMDIAIGIARMLGITLKENFDRPFTSRSVKEYWNRWHITMGSWFTDYIFYPLSVSLWIQKVTAWFEKHPGEGFARRFPVYFATLVTWLLTGIWHGAGWNFLVWGLLNGVAILISNECKPLFNRFHARFPKIEANLFWRSFQIVRTFLLMGLFRSLDVYRDVGRTFRLWGSMFTVFNVGEAAQNWGELGLLTGQWVFLLFAVGLLIAVSAINARRKLTTALTEKPVLFVLLACLLVTATLVFGTYGIGYDAGGFIYQQF